MLMFVLCRKLLRQAYLYQASFKFVLCYYLLQILHQTEVGRRW